MGAPFVTTQTLRFCDTDALGHVNNATYATMYEAGRAEMVAQAGLLDAAGGFAVVIARIEIDFLREMNWPGEVRIETAVTRIGTKSATLRGRLLVGGEVTSRASAVIAIIDTATRRAVPLTEAWRALLEQWLVPDFQ